MIDANALRDEIRRHDFLYYVEARPIISDRDYDALMSSLRAIEDKSGDIPADSPTQRVGGQPLDGFETVSHNLPMLSVDNTYDADQLPIPQQYPDELRRHRQSPRESIL